ncbi:MAG: hypothetical protein JSU96_12890 [Acidobacteriota bacterium]|nr:MAG: hypothetical protein JSU96_12890 [Acidobacteriota bacterium]
MSNELKSALDLALEKLDREMGGAPARLSEDQKKRIAEVRAKYKARIAEAEIASQGKLKLAVQAQDPSLLDQLKADLGREKLKLEERSEAEVAKIRAESGTD